MIAFPNNVPILGTGVDILEHARLRRAIDRTGQAFLDRIFTAREQAYCLAKRDPIPSLANRFCAKEAMAKASGLGIAKLGLTHVSVANRDDGAPFLIIEEPCRDRLIAALGLLPTVHLSLSDTQTLSIATILLTP